MKKNVEMSLKLAKNKKVRPIPKQCYRNASRVVLRVPEFAAAAYVEGIAVSHQYGMGIEHGWVEHGGHVLDPTLPGGDYAYFPGLRFEGRESLERAVRTIPMREGESEVLPLFFRFGWGGCDSLEFCRAWDEAWDYAFRRGLLRGDRPRSYVEAYLTRNPPPEVSAAGGQPLATASAGMSAARADCGCIDEVVMVK